MVKVSSRDLDKKLKKFGRRSLNSTLKLGFVIIKFLEMNNQNVLVGNLLEAKLKLVSNTSWHLRTNKEHLKNLSSKIFKNVIKRGRNRSF
jgi:hypothetical protein